MGAVEPSLEKAMEPLEYEGAGERGVGLGFLSACCCDLDLVERRLIHEGLRIARRAVVSDSAVPWSLGG